MNIDSLRVSAVQSWIDHEDVESNLSRYGKLMSFLVGKTDLVVLPELFTGGSVRVGAPAERMDGRAMELLRIWSSAYDFAIVGSLLIEECGRYYNRVIFVHPDGGIEYGDKRHLFCKGGESEWLTAGTVRRIVRYKGWRICLLSCYDLRFPVWSRNVGNEYDLLLYPSNWPTSRGDVWDILLRARAIENQSYVCGVNRVGSDIRGVSYRGRSMLISPQGDVLMNLGTVAQIMDTRMIRKSELVSYRAKFPVWRAADGFSRIERGISSIC